MSNVGTGSYTAQVLTWDNSYLGARWMPRANPTTGYVLTWNGTEVTWAVAPSGFTAGGDLSGTPTSQTVIGIRGRTVAATAPTDGQVLTWVNGSSNWAPVTPGGGGPGGTPSVYANVAAAEAATGSDDDLCYVVAVDSWYRYEATDAVVTRDGLVVLNTGNGGNTRWIAVAGRYGNIISRVPVDGNTFGRTFLGSGAMPSAAGYYSTALGYHAGYSLVGGNYVTLVGAYAGASLVNNSYCTFIGYRAGASAAGSVSSIVAIGDNAYGGATGIGAFAQQGTYVGSSAGYLDAGYENTYIGTEAGYGAAGDPVGSYNLGIGYRALYAGPGWAAGGGGYPWGGRNIAAGTQAGYNLTHGYQNSLIGYQAGYDLVDGQNNSVLGGSIAGIVSGSYNCCINGRVLGTLDSARSFAVGIGYGSGGSGGNYTVYIGYECGYNTGLAHHNVGIGYQALKGGTSVPLTGTGNIAMGEQALTALESTASYNVGFGRYAGKGIVDASDNLCLGYNAGYALASSGGNVAAGRDALLNATQASPTTGGDTAIGHNSGRDVTSGVNNTFCGRESGRIITTGSGNTCVGYLSGVDSASSSNRSALGYAAICLYDNAVRLGSNGTGGYPSTQVYGGTYNTDSDIRLKMNVEDCDLGLNFVLALTPRKFEMKDAPGKKHHGFIAQEVASVLGDLGIESNIHSAPAGDGPQSVAYAAMVAPLIKAVQELSIMVDSLQAEVAELEARRAS